MKEKHLPLVENLETTGKENKETHSITLQAEIAKMNDPMHFTHTRTHTHTHTLTHSITLQAEITKMNDPMHFTHTHTHTHVFIPVIHSAFAKSLT